MIRPVFAISALTLAVTSAASARCNGSSDCPIEIHMARGTDTIVLTGDTSKNPDCCDYVFRARAGQKLFYWIDGANLRTVIVYPNGDADGPGLPNPIPLPQSGRYRFGVHAHQMAEGGYGPFRLTLTIR